MKKRIWVLTSLAFFIVAIGVATERPKMNVVPVSAKKAMVVFQSTGASPLEITLTNRGGEVLYQKRTKKQCSEYKKILDFSELGEGRYSVSVNYGNCSIGRAICVEKEKILVGLPQRRYQPYFSLDNQKLNVSFLNCPQKQVYVHIYQNGKHIAGLDLGNELAIQERLDLSELRKGEYEIIFSEHFKCHKYIAQL